jgi:hypothetical protein
MMATATFSVAYCPFSNGVAESAVKKIKRSLRHLLSELKAGADLWPWVLPVAEAACNGCPSARLGGRCPLELLVGAKPKHVLDVMVKPTKKGVVLSDPISPDKLQQYADELRDAMADLHHVTSELRREDLIKIHKRREQLSGPIPEWLPGTFVLRLLPTSRRRSSIHGRWVGPYVIKDVLSKHLYRIQALGGDRDEMVAHVSRLRYFSAAGLDVSETLIEQATFEEEAWPIDKLLDHRPAEGGSFVLLTRWLGFDPIDDSWEPLASMVDSVPGLVKRYIDKQSGPDKRRLTAAVEALKPR